MSKYDKISSGVVLKGLNRIVKCRELIKYELVDVGLYALNVCETR